MNISAAPLRGIATLAGRAIDAFVGPKEDPQFLELHRLLCAPDQDAVRIADRKDLT